MPIFTVLVAIAEIAGVFVGFGALISVTRRTRSEAAQIGRIRAVVTIGLLVIIAAIIPVVLNEYGLEDHTLWFIASLLFLLLNLVLIIVSLRRADNKELMTTQTRTNPLMAAVFWILLELPVQLPLFLLLIGIWPHLDPALYLTSLVCTMFEAAFVLAQLVYAREVLT